jgi:ABC-2 type transport system ATP-binding protein
MNEQKLPIIKIAGLRKTFAVKKRGKSSVIEAVRRIDLEVKRGEIFGLLGPNGAGKTTTMRMLCTLLAPTSGQAKIVGYDLLAQPEEIRKCIGYVSQLGGMKQVATGRENLMLQAQLYGMSREKAEQRVSVLLKELKIAQFADRKISTYSGGQKRIFDLVAGIVHWPQLLFLDEPTTGLDPQNRAYVWEEVKKLHDEGTAIFLTTHYMEEADKLCDRVAIIDYGKVVSIGSPSQLKQGLRGDSITLEFDDNGVLQEALRLLKKQPFVKDIQSQETSLHLYVADGDKTLSRVVSLLHEKDINAVAVSVSHPTLEDVFLKLTGRTLREKEGA